MRSRATRLSVGAGGLVVLWIAAFWWIDTDPTIRFDERGSGSQTAVTRGEAAPDDAALSVSSADGAMMPAATGHVPGAVHTGESAPESVSQAGRGAPVELQEDESTPMQGDVPPAAVRLYTIQPGDLLSRIAQREYGSIRYTDFLYEHNRERLGLASPDAIREGQVLEIPPLDDAPGTGDRGA